MSRLSLPGAGAPDLLQPVRRNLRALTDLLHADGEVVTEISRRQDQYTRGGVNGYWFPLTYLAVTDQDGAARFVSGRAPRRIDMYRCEARNQSCPNISV